MTPARLVEIKNKISSLNTTKIRAEAQMEQVQATWKTQYGVSTQEEIQALITTKKEVLARDRERLEVLGNKLESLVDWDSL